MGRGRASAFKVCAIAHKCQKNIFFKYSRFTHQKKRLKSLIIKKNIEKCRSYSLKKLLKIDKCEKSAFLQVFDTKLNFKKKFKTDFCLIISDSSSAIILANKCLKLGKWPILPFFITL